MGAGFAQFHLATGGNRFARKRRLGAAQRRKSSTWHQITGELAPNGQTIAAMNNASPTKHYNVSGPCRQITMDPQ